jgi:hypothetical protein
MKKLQNNYTTIEQSKRLLELGVPADSADLFYYSLNKITQRLGKFDLCIVGNTTISSLKETADEEGLIVIPCWSVGRLIEIYLLCAELKKPQMIFIKEDVLMMDRIINELCRMAESERLDFSKLDE